jgi:hypothetical protein
MTRTVRAGLLASALIGASGCAVLLVGAGAAGGYAISKDSVKNNFDLPESHVFRVARDVITDEGLITTEDEKRGLLKATVEGAKVTITVKPLTRKTVELKVKARDSSQLLPKVDVAQVIYTKILERLD